MYYCHYCCCCSYIVTAELLLSVGCVVWNNHLLHRIIILIIIIIIIIIIVVVVDSYKIVWSNKLLCDTEQVHTVCCHVVIIIISPSLFVSIKLLSLSLFVLCSCSYWSNIVLIRQTTHILCHHNAITTTIIIIQVWYYLHIAISRSLLILPFR